MWKSGSLKWWERWLKNQCILLFVVKCIDFFLVRVCIYICVYACMHAYIYTYIVIEYREQHCGTLPHCCHPLVGKHHTPLGRHTLSGRLHQHLWREGERERRRWGEVGGFWRFFCSISADLASLLLAEGSGGGGVFMTQLQHHRCQSCFFLLSISLSVALHSLSCLLINLQLPSFCRLALSDVATWVQIETVLLIFKSIFGMQLTFRWCERVCIFCNFSQAPG